LGPEYFDSSSLPKVPADKVAAHANQILAVLEKAFTMGDKT
jgi:hypothetical protein